MTNQRRLGRGLEALLGRPLENQNYEPDAAAPRVVALDAGEVLVDAPVTEIDANPYQPRREFDPEELSALTESLREHGLLQPLLVRRHGERYQLIAGERRLRAAVAAGWETVSVRVQEADDRQMAELAIVENLQRKDLNPLEKARAFREYLEQYGTTKEELAGRLQLDRSTVSNLLRLLELPLDVQRELEAGRLTQGHARALLPLGDEREQVAFCQQIIDEGWSVRQTEEHVKTLIHEADREPLADLPSGAPASGSGRTLRQVSRSNHMIFLQQDLQRMLGTRVELRQTDRGHGRMVIHFKNTHEFDRLMRIICGPPEGDTRRDAG